MRKDILEKRPLIEAWIQEGKTKTFICNELQCKPTTLNKYLEEMGITYKGNPSGKGQKKHKHTMDIYEYLANSTGIQSSKIRIKLLASGLKEHKCECCGLTDWLGNKIPLEVHHKDGNPSNNSLENFEVICPNCHALTDTYRGKNCKH